jgi:PAS domain S-box-containing protein
MADAGKIPILMVDDRPENLTALEALLADLDLDLELVMASSGNEALRHSLRADFALILLDVQMPGMDGMETATLLRANPKTRHLPIIFITAGLNEKSYLFRGYESGAVDYLIKPIEPIVLRSKVRAFCDLYAQRVEIEFCRANLETIVQERTAELSTLAHNLTEEVKAHRATEQALHDSELRTRCVIDSAYEAFIGMDGEGNIFDWNRQAETTFGWRRDEVVGKAVDEVIVPARYRERHAQGLRHFLDTGEGQVLNNRIELSALHRSGKEFPVELSIWTIPNASGCIFGAFVRDITERKRAEEELRQLNESLEMRVQERTQELRLAMNQIVESEKLASLGSLVAGVAHELSTPIGNIVMTASTLADTSMALAESAAAGTLTRSRLHRSAEDSKAASALIVRSALRASELIDSFKKVAVDQTSQRRRKFDLRVTVGDILQTMGTVMRHAKASCELRIPEGIAMDSVPGDLEQILNNLIMNSIHHGFEGRGGGHIVIDARCHGELVEIDYRDDGNGIAPELQRKVFDPFYTTKLGQGGSGLGMFIVHNLIHGPLKGDIRIDSEVGKGVVFTMSLPTVTPYEACAHKD